MMEVGQLLRQTREAQELSLADIEEKTKIRQSFISALESGDWDDLPNEVVARGFLRKYAVALGLNPDELLAQAGGGQSSLVDQPTSAGETTSAAQTASAAYQPINLELYDVTPESSHRLRRVLGFLLALIPVALLAYLLIQFGLPLLLDQSAGLTTNPTATATLPPAGTPPATPLIVLDGALTPTTVATDAPNKTPDQPTDTPEASTTDTPTSTPSPTPTVTPIQQLTMQMEVIERAWVRVTVDGEVLLESLLDPVYVQEFVGQESIELRTGNAAGVIVTLNGEQLPPLGETAEVVDLIWTIEDDEIIVTTPTSEPEPTASLTPETEITGTPTVGPEVTATPTPTVEATAAPTAEPDTPTPEPPTPEPPTPEPQDTETPTPGA